MHNRQSTCPSYWYKSGCITKKRCIIMLHFASSSSNVWLTFQAKNNARSTPACNVLTRSRTKAIMHVLEIVTYAVREKGMEYKGEQKWALVEPWCKHLSCCGWWKGMSPDDVTLNSWEKLGLKKGASGKLERFSSINTETKYLLNKSALVQSSKTTPSSWWIEGIGDQQHLLHHCTVQIVSCTVVKKIFPLGPSQINVFSLS